MEILDVLGQLPNLFRLWRCEIDDRPRITVTKVAPAAGKPQSRDSSRLSLGQQQSVLLALMRSSDYNMPLIAEAWYRKEIANSCTCGAPHGVNRETGFGRC